jgi:hypothetical protein
VPVGAALLANDVPVDNTASFSASLVGVLPGNANPVSGTMFDIDVTLSGTIQSMDVGVWHRRRHGRSARRHGLDLGRGPLHRHRRAGADRSLPGRDHVDAGVDAP